MSLLRFARLSTIPPDIIAAHLSDPRMATHMPLLKGPWTRPMAEDFIRAKEERWQRDGLGHWAFLLDDRYVGWGGFEREANEWDFGLVLTPAAFGMGPRITEKALSFARADDRIPYVTFLLAPSRRRLRGLERLGARPVGPVHHEGATFLKYRLDTPGR